MARSGANNTSSLRMPSLPVLLVAVLMVVASTLPQMAAAHEGCGQHSPLVVQQQQVLRRRLQQLRNNDAAKPAAAAASSSSSTKSSPQELRIGPVYQLGGIGNRDAQRIEKQLVPAAIKVLQKFLKVIRPAGPPRVSKAFFEGDSNTQQDSCLISKASPALAAAGKDNDLSLYITAEGTGCLAGMIAVATACEVDPATKRPILGSLNICPSALAGLDGLAAGSEAYGYAMGRLVEVLVHEIIHVLGFGSNHYDDWRGPDGKPYGRKNVIVSQGGRPYLATPKVTKVTRDYFGCSSLPGAPLEDEGPAFSATSHFEYRLLQRELMSPARPIDRSRARLSDFTLAALEDSGWYTADYTDAEPLDWGRGAGCDFVLSTCWDYITKNPGQPYFCGKGTVNQTRCTAAASGWGVCRSSTFTDACLLVGKYSSDTSVAVKDDVAASGADGRAAACYSPPQLEALQSAGNKGNLLPLLGGSFSSQPSDICYNLISQPKPTNSGGGGSSSSSSSSSSSASSPGCTVPEDCAGGGGGSKPQGGRRLTETSGLPSAEEGASASAAGGLYAPSGVVTRQGRVPLASLEAIRPTVFTFYEQDVKQGGVRSMNEAGMSSDRTAVCVSVAEDLSAGGSNNKGSSGSSSGSNSKPKRRALLSLLSDAAHSLSHLTLQSGRQLAFASSSEVPVAVAVAVAPQSRALLAASRASFTAVVQGPAAPASTAAACTSSPVLCFRSSCDSSGQLFVEAQLPASGGSSSNSNSVKFACPSGKSVDLSKALAGRYLLGVLQCPSNQLVCETTGCGDCSPSGGSCHRGKCFCHMERFGPGCKQTVVPQM